MPFILRAVAAFLLAASAVVACGRPGARPAGSTSPVAVEVDTVHYTALDPGKGPDVFGSCAPTPQPEGDWRQPGAYWLPDPALIAEAEARLPPLLDSVFSRLHRANPSLSTLQPRDYYRQYLGFMRGGERLVFIHGFHEVLLQNSGGSEGVPATTLDWRSSVPAWCDAGAGLFGVVYDPRTRTFGRLEFSFTFGGPVTY